MPCEFKFALVVWHSSGSCMGFVYNSDEVLWKPRFMRIGQLKPIQGSRVAFHTCLFRDGYDHVKALEVGQSSQGTSESITPAFIYRII